MNMPSAVSTGLGCLLLCAGVLSATPGCSGTEPFPEVDDPGVTDGPAPVALPGGGHVVTEYVLQVRPRSRTTKLLRLKPGVSSQPGFNPQSVDTINVVQDDVAGSGPAGSVELNTTNVTYGNACPGGLDASFCGTVALGSFYTRPLNNVFVQATSITDNNGVALTGHSGINSDSAPTWLHDTGLGLWKYNAPGAPAGVIGTTPNNFGTKTWVFADPDGQDTNILLRVVATLSYTDYSMAPSAQPFIDACPANSAKPTNLFASAVIGFPFTFYAVQATTAAKFTRDGVVTFGGGSPPVANNLPFANVTLPESTASVSVSPGLYVFWDQLNYTGFGSAQGTSALCSQTTGSAPNRLFTVTWKNMKGFKDTDDTTNLTFSAIMTEGTDTIDVVYGSMLGGNVNDPNVSPAAPTVTYAQRAAGAKAIVGVEGPFRSVNISTPQPAARNFTDTSTGKAYRFTPIP